MNERKYFYVREGNTSPTGPHTLAELARMKSMGDLTDDTPVAAAGAQRWEKLGELLTAHETEQAACSPDSIPIPQAAQYPQAYIHPQAYRGPLPAYAGPCPNCSHEIPLSEPMLPEHCPHCQFTLRAQNPESMWQQFIVAFKKMFVWRGRATRMEYWSFYLFSNIISVIISLFSDIAGSAKAYAYSEKSSYLYSDIGAMSGPALMLQIAVSLIFVIPGISVTIRRLHDIGRSGIWLLTAPILTIIIFISIVMTIASAATHSSSADFWPAIMMISIVLFIIISITMFVFMVSDSKPGSNKYGASPKYPYL